MVRYDGNNVIRALGMDDATVAYAREVLVTRNGKVVYAGPKASAPYSWIRNETPEESDRRFLARVDRAESQLIGDRLTWVE